MLLHYTTYYLIYRAYVILDIFCAGSHLELMKIPEGAYSQLIHLQESQQEAEISNVDPDIEIMNASVSRSISSKPRSQSLSRNSSGKISTTSGLSGRHSFVAPLGVSDPTEFNDALDLEENAQKVQSALKKAPIGRLFYLNKPEAFVLALGSITAAMVAVQFPIFGTLVSTAIKSFYEPTEELLKHSRFSAIMFVALGAYAFVLNPIVNIMFGIAGGKLVERVRSMTFQSIMRQEINWFDKPEHSRYVYPFSHQEHVMFHPRLGLDAKYLWIFRRRSLFEKYFVLGVSINHFLALIFLIVGK